MILIDTNVILEIMKVEPSQTVVSWLNAQKSGALYVSAVSIGELKLVCGSCRSANANCGSKKGSRGLFRWPSHSESSVLAYDEIAARAYGEIMDFRKEAGRPMNLPDGQIAAIARANSVAIATRNTRDFE